jgi:asparagine synthase (glutamine-hydrolysing)
LVNGVEKSLLREAATGLIPEEIRTRKKSALPKDQGCEAAYRGLAARVASNPAETTRAMLNLGHVRQIARMPQPLSENQRAMLFQTVVFDAWVRHHGVLPP